MMVEEGGGKFSIRHSHLLDASEQCCKKIVFYLTSFSKIIFLLIQGAPEKFKGIFHSGLLIYDYFENLLF